MKFSIMLLLATSALVACSTPDSRDKFTLEQKENNRRRQALDAAVANTVVDSSDGIAALEAYKIAHGYFFGGDFISCGMVDVPMDEGSKWRVPLLEGLFPVLTKYVLIDKKTGAYRIETIQKE